MAGLPHLPAGSEFGYPITDSGVLLVLNRGGGYLRDPSKPEYP